MPNKIQIRRGLKANLPTLSVGEPGFTTDTKEVFIGDGTANIELATTAYVEEQITLMSESGVPKLNVYEYKFADLAIGTTTVQIPLASFDKVSDTVKLYINAIPRDSDFFTVSATGLITLTSALTSISKVTVEVWKNVVAGGDGTVSGNVLVVNSVPQDRIIGLATSLSAKANTTAIPTTLPANGGNADTVDNKHASDFKAATEVVPLTYGGTGATDAATARTNLGLGSVNNTADTAKNVLSATKLTTARTLAFTGDATGTGSFDGSANLSTALTLANSGATAGTYKSVTVDAKGRVTAGTNPTTLTGYGITDGVNKTISLADGTNLNTVLESGFYRVNTGSTNTPQGLVYGQLIVSRGSDTIVQMYSHYDTGNVYTRTANGIGGTVTWQPWKKQVDTDLSSDSLTNPGSATDVRLWATQGNPTYRFITVNTSTIGNVTNIPLGGDVEIIVIGGKAAANGNYYATLFFREMTASRTFTSTVYNTTSFTSWIETLSHNSLLNYQFVIRKNGNATDYTNSTLQIQTGDGTAPGIGFHRGGYSAVNLHEESSRLFIRTNGAANSELLASIPYGSSKAGFAVQAATPDTNYLWFY